MNISIVVAMAENGVIGRDNSLPWRLSTDLRRFKSLTMGKPLVMGRKCFDSIGKPLPGRENIVITRNPEFSREGVAAVHSLEEALERGAKAAAMMDTSEIAVIGGGEIYRQAMNLADRLCVTHVLASVDGDAFFPSIDPAIWRIASEEAVPAGDKDDYPTRFAVYVRKGPK